jgi:RNA-directed DNA polymerase
MIDLANIKSYYNIYRIRKPNGKFRIIEEPNNELKDTQKVLLSIFTQAELHTACSSGPHGSIVAAATPHYDSASIIKLDIRDCFQTTTKEKVIQGMAYCCPSNKKQTDWLNQTIPLLDFCFIPNKNGQLVLPTGAPTSPILCNIALTPLDMTINYLCTSLKLQYTRYMDDLHISGTNPEELKSIYQQLCSYITDMNYKVNWIKSGQYAINKNTKVIVTGIRLGTPKKVPRSLRRKVRAKLEYLAREQQPLDMEAQGFLAHIKNIDSQEYTNTIGYYQKRLNNAYLRQSIRS